MRDYKKQSTTYKTNLLLVVLTAGVFWIGLLTQSAYALPTLFPHPHGDGKVYWEEDGTKNGDDDHNHLFPHSVQGSAGAGHVHDAFAVWDNRTYRYNVGAPTFTGGLQDPFWHGFIETDKEPRYIFEDGIGASKTFDDTSKGLIGSAVEEWVTKAKAQSAGKKTPDGTLPLVTGIGLIEAPGIFFEIRIGFFEGPDDGTLAEWLISDKQITDPTTGWFDSGLVIGDLDTSPILAFDDDINWLFTEDATITPSGTQYDFLTIATHELGHVFGLHHAPGDPAGNIMRENIYLEARYGNKRRTVDESSARGAAELYTQPVPEPSTLVLMGSGIIFMARWVRRNRRNG